MTIMEVISLVCFIPTKFKTIIEKQNLAQEFQLSMYSLRDVTAIFKNLPVEEFIDSAKSKKMEDINYLLPHLLDHEELIEKIYKHAPVFPVQFGVLFSSQARLSEQILQQYNLILLCLKKIAKKEEWAIKGFLDQAKAIDKFTKIALSKYQLGILKSGARYLKEQRIRNETKQQLNSYLQEILQKTLQNLIQYASDFKERELVFENIHDNNQMVINWALLVPINNIGELNKKIKEINDTYLEYGLNFITTGPWPPYSFCTNFINKQIDS